MSEIKITIEGKQGVGKTIISNEIFKFLSEKGHSVVFKDEKTTLFSRNAIKKKNIGANIPIYIQTKQVA